MNLSPPAQELVKEALRKEGERFEGKLQSALDRVRDRAEQRLEEELRVGRVTFVACHETCETGCDGMVQVEGGSCDPLKDLLFVQWPIWCVIAAPPLCRWLM